MEPTTTTPTTTMDASALPPIELPRRPFIDLFLISFLILFFELACIRWFGSTVVFLTFFTNIVLLACFLGMSVGLLTATRKQDYIRWVFPLSFLAIALAVITYNLYIQYWQKVTVSVGPQQSSPQLIYFGTEYRPQEVGRWIVPIWAVGGIFFTLVTLMFIGLGQQMGRAFDAIPHRVGAYTIDVLGSLTGIAAFGAVSYYQLTPNYWFLVVVLILAYFVRRWTYIQVLSAVGIIFLLGLSAYGAGIPERIFWSPYYKVAFDREKLAIETNNISHQEMMDIGKDGAAYLMPHLLNRDADGGPFENVMIIGAGSGNDVAAALRSGAKRIDAVEIDPQINLLGQQYHPDKPYQDPRVNSGDAKKGAIHITDGRRFMRKKLAETGGKGGEYDLITYSLVDSLVLHSGYSSIRLENFLFTKQAMQDAKANLKPGGVFAMYNYFRQGWVVARLAKMAKEVFGVDPIVISMPYTEEIKPGDKMEIMTFLIVGTDSPRLEAIRKKFAVDKQHFFVNWHPNESEARNGFSAEPPEPGKQWLKFSPAKVDFSSIRDEEIPTDNWPQLYLKSAHIPWAPTGQGIVTVAVLSVLILVIFSWPIWFGRNRVGRRFNWQMFFLGAGFMLLETKGVVHMALLFGSTWIVNSVVFFAILVMILIANVYVIAIRPRKLLPYYGLLVLSLLVNAVVPMEWFLSLSPTARTISSCAVVFIPVFFAGVIFASAFRDSTQPDVDFGCNVAGIILGGLSEQLSLMIGFNYLIFVAIAYYLLSMLLAPRARSSEPVPSTPEPAAVPDAVPA